jgi:hypothetical protein
MRDPEGYQAIILIRGCIERETEFLTRMFRVREQETIPRAWNTWTAQLYYRSF